MDRDELLKKLKRYARQQALDFEFDKARGKGSHGTIVLGKARAVCPRGELKTGTLAAILKQLGVTLNDLNKG